MRDPSTGPFTREQFKALVDAPFGGALKEIRKVDPLYGRAEGEKIKWRVRLTARMAGEAYVMAADLKEAENLACEIDDAQVDFCDFIDSEIEGIEPA